MDLSSDNYLIFIFGFNMGKLKDVKKIQSLKNNERPIGASKKNNFDSEHAANSYNKQRKSIRYAAPYMRSMRKRCEDALLYVPSHPARELDKDLKAAGIPKRTSEGKIAFHALRTSFVTLAYEAGANHKEAQELARHSNPTLTANTYGRTRNERLVKVTEMVADRVLLGGIGANMVHETKDGVAEKTIKLLPKQQLTNQSRQWRRGDSNPQQGIFVSPLLARKYNLTPFFIAT